MNGIMRSQQTGVVLVFSLLILLLVTLLGVNMVQQNRVQFLMAGNAQQQMTTFSNAEDVLTLAEEYINQTRYAVWPFVNASVPYPDPNYTCKKDAAGKLDQFKPNTSLTDKINLAQGFIDAGSTVFINQTSCFKSDVKKEFPCTVDTTTASGWASVATDPLSYCGQNTPTHCHTEIYTLLVTIVDDSGGKREIESKYAVRCDM